MMRDVSTSRASETQHAAILFYYKVQFTGAQRVWSCYAWTTTTASALLLNRFFFTLDDIDARRIVEFTPVAPEQQSEAPTRVTSPRWANDPEAPALPEAWVTWPTSVVDSRRCARARFETASSLFSPFVCGAWRIER